ncbi:MAG: tetratricopeptide repeat protein [Cytophagaceae bacterium]|jgi:predicted O-linked N-acetylglucosamine transferase (SPINDLY family)|nr:tetratricopeptide repeat protein [Cytophagaceae bacterium]
MKKVDQDSFNSLMGFAQRSHQNGDLSIAINLYKEALKVKPKQIDALHYLGIAYCGLQNYEQGILYLEKALALGPENPILLTNLSNAYFKIHAYAKALPLLQQSISIKPDFDEAWHKLGNALKALNRLEEAIPAYQKAIALNPKNFTAYYNAGNTMLALGNYKSAISLYESCLLVNPDYPPALNNLGIALIEWDRLDEAENHYLRAIQIQPNYKDAIKNLVHLYARAGKDSQSKKWVNELLKLNPEDAYVRFELETKAPIIPSGNQDIDAYRNGLMSLLANTNPDSMSNIAKLVENACFPSSELIYQGRINKDLKVAYDRLFQAIPKLNVQHSNTKPHVGFVVTAGHEGVFLKCMKGILNNIDTTRMEVSVVCSLPNGRKIIQPALSNRHIRFIELPFVFNKAQEVLVDSKFDVLYYWEIGTDATNYFLALTKPAKVQVTSWGWPVTSGLKSVDYFLSQKQLESDNAQDQYTEKLILFSRIPVYYYRPPVPSLKKTLSYYGLPDTKRLYICQQNVRKVHPDFDLLIAALLEKDPEGIVLFIKDKQDAITESLQRRLSKTIGRDMQRVHFLPRMEEGDYLGLLAQCSVALDTLHYGGGANTVYDAIEAGIPYITLEGNKHSARFATAVFKQMGVEDTITHSVDEYVEKAIEISCNIELRTDIVSRMKRHDNKIFEDIAAVRELEDFLVGCLH